MGPTGAGKTFTVRHVFRGTLTCMASASTGTPSNPSEALENVGIVVLVGFILVDTDDAVEEEEVVVVVMAVVGEWQQKLELTSSCKAANIGSHDC